MQEMDPRSYYALAGIHGYPYQPWPASPSHSDDAGVDTTKKKTQLLGYCTHGTVLFPTWHRPYILALEVSLPSPPHSLIHSLTAHIATPPSSRNSPRIPLHNPRRILLASRCPIPTHALLGLGPPSLTTTGGYRVRDAVGYYVQR